MIAKNVSLVSLIVLEKFSLKSWNLTRNVWLINILPPSNFALQRAENYSDCWRYGKTGNKKHSTCFAPLLQNELHIKPVLHQIKLLTGLKVGGKTCKISLELFCSNGAKQVACFLSPVFPYFSEQPVPSASTTKSAVFYWLLFGEVCPENTHEITAKSADFSANLSLKIQGNLTFSSATCQKPWSREKTGNKKHATCFVVVIAKTEKNLY